MALRFFASAIPDEELVLFGEVARHRGTHGAEADECDFHRSILSGKPSWLMWSWRVTHAASLRRTPHQNSSSIETLRHALQRERGSFSNCRRRHAHSPALPSFGSEVGT